MRWRLTYKGIAPRPSWALMACPAARVSHPRRGGRGGGAGGVHLPEPLARGGEPLLRARNPHHQLLELQQVVRLADLLPVLGDERLDQREDDDVLGVGVVEHLLVDGA